MTTTTQQQQPEDSVDDSNKTMIIDIDDEYVYETHVVGRLPFSRQEPIEPEIIFSTDKLWQDDQSDVDTESILATDSEDEVITSSDELEEPPNDGACCECKLPRSN